PTAQHLPLVRRAAACELPILCEKPCGLTAAEARQAARVATDAGVRLQVAYWRRFVTTLQHLQHAIADGRFGEVYSIACWQWDEQPPASGFRATSGGIFIDMGVHEFDQMRWLTGQEIVGLDAAVSTVAADTVLPPDADSAQTLCRLSGGGTGIVSLGRRFQPGDAAWVQVFGTRNAEECRFLWPDDGDTVFMEALRLQAEDFAAGGGSGATSADAIAALEAAERAGSVAFNRN
ncbi:MAG: Gfo/Idh/MocA family protein, partial [Acetobacteraceae bacterium]